MSVPYVFCGSEGFIGAVEQRLGEAEFVRVHDAATAEVALSFCTSQSALEDLYFGDAGLIQKMAPGSLLIDVSATTPNFAREINAVATVSDLVMVEAPMVVADMAHDPAFERDNLVCFAASEDDSLARALPLLDVLACRVHESGGPGSAQLARAACTLQVAAQVIASIESDALFRAHRRSVCGFNLDSARPGAIAPQADAVLDAIQAGRFEGDYNAEMLMAELSAAIMAADDVELILPQAEAAMHLLELLSVIGGAGKAPAALSLVYGEEAECAKHGLDWSRAEQLYGTDEHDGCDDYDDYEGDGCGCEGEHGHRFDDYDGYDMDDPYGTFSNN